MDNYTVYMHTFMLNPNRVYVGITKQDPEKRWGKDGSGYKNQRKFYNSIKKYRWNYFFHDIVATGLSYEDAKKMETELVEKYDSIHQRFNSVSGGNEGIRTAIINRYKKEHKK